MTICAILASLVLNGVNGIASSSKVFYPVDDNDAVVNNHSFLQSVEKGRSKVLINKDPIIVGMGDDPEISLIQKQLMTHLENFYGKEELHKRLNAPDDDDFDFAEDDDDDPADFSAGQFLDNDDDDDDGDADDDDGDGDADDDDGDGDGGAFFQKSHAPDDDQYDFAEDNDDDPSDFSVDQFMDDDKDFAEE